MATQDITQEHVQAWEGFLKSVDNLVGIQRDGIPAYKSNTGQPYYEISSGMLSRPEDFNVVFPVALKQFSRQIQSYVDLSKGLASPGESPLKIYWRRRPEFALEKHRAFYFYDKYGPDTDYLIDKKGWADDNWIYIKFYCRLLVTNLSDLPQAEIDKFYNAPVAV